MPASAHLSKVWDDYLGQGQIVSQLNDFAQEPVHAYLFLGSTGTYNAAVRFAAAILASGASDPDNVVRRVKDFKHPDLVLIEPEGATLRVSDSQEVIRVSSVTPVEANKKVVLIPNVDSIEDNAIGKLLKIIEEPPASTVFILLAESVLPEIVTIASRCVQLSFSPYSDLELEKFLLTQGHDASMAALAASSAGGSLERAQLLVSDSGLINRAEQWAKIPAKLDGSGSTASMLVQDVLAGFEAALEPLSALQQVELEELDKRVEELGERGSGRAALLAKHKREARKLRVDELKFGFAILARHFRDELINGSDLAKTSHADKSIHQIQLATEALQRNPNETLLLQNLLSEIGPLS